MQRLHADASGAVCCDNLHHFVSLLFVECVAMGRKGRQVVEQKVGIRWGAGFVPTAPSLLSYAMVCAARSEGCSEDWILDRNFTYHYRDLRLWGTFIKVLGLML